MSETLKGKPTVFETVQKSDPSRNPAFNAVDLLEDPVEMREFMAQYADYLRTSEEPDVVANADQVALSNMGYITVYYGPEVVERWKGVFAEMTHPVFDQPFQVSPAQAMQFGGVVAEALTAQDLPHKA
jgi:hypothetical protein